MFDALGRALAGHFTVIAYDQRDSGATQKSAVPYGLADLADDAAALDRRPGLRSRACAWHLAGRSDRTGAGGAASRAGSTGWF